MTPDRWRRIEDLFNAAREMEPAARASLLAQADPDLREEVESLLAQPDLPTATQKAINALSPGAQLGPYRIEAVIGAGGMGKVFRATDTRLRRTVAIKTLLDDMVADPARRRRFLHEARAASALNHPNIVTLYDIANDGDADYLVMEYVEGRPLDKLIPAGGLPLGETLDYAIQIAAALAAAHAAGIVHRDIKPSNMIVTAEGQIKVLDFGLAKSGEPALDAGDPTLTLEPKLTEAGMVIGTIAWMSPEQARGEDVDARTDLFSFGVVLYEMATGRRPFLRKFDWTPPSAISLPAPLQPVVMKLLEPDRERRYQQVSEVRADLLRSQQGTAAGKRPALLLAAASLLVVTIVGWLFLPKLFSGPARLTDKDTIILADFKNSTGDPVFDETLRRGLTVELGQSPFLSLIGDEKIRQNLSLMGQPPDGKFTAALARLVCIRTGGAAFLEGSIASLGTKYVVGLSARNCETGDALVEEQVQAGRKEEVLDSLSQIARTFRTKIGESLATVEKHSTPLAEATTSSLEALKAFSEGNKITVTRGPVHAIPLLKRAVELDPDFALAHALLGRVYGDIAESELSAASTTAAWRLRNRASDRERFFIDASYEWQVTGNLEKARETCESWAQTYPRDVNAHGFLSAFIYQGVGRYQDSIREAEASLAVNPDFIFGYGNLAWDNLYLDRPGEAAASLRRAAKRKLEIPDQFTIQYMIAFLQGNHPEIQRILTAIQGKPGTEDWVNQEHAFALAFSGRLDDARKFSAKAEQLAKQASQNDRAAQYAAATAVLEAFFENTSEARRKSAEALALSRSRDVLYGAALAQALSGDSSRSQALSKDLARHFPEDTFVKFSYLPVLHALNTLQAGQEGSPAKALEILQVAAPNEMGAPGSTFAFFGALYPVYVRGQAYLAAHRGSEAAAEFAKILDHRGIVLNDPIGALSHLQLARARKMSGDNAGAKAAYQDFLTLWKDAGADIALLKKARTELAALL